MIDTHDNLAEQLSAYMDGELPQAESRFLQRRLEHDADLRALWERMQLGSTCMKGQPWLPMRDACAGVRRELDAAPAMARRRPVMGWAIAASLAALALVLGPRLMPAETPAALPSYAETSVPAAGRPAPSPASADLVAVGRAASIAEPSAAGSQPDTSLVVNSGALEQSSPLAQSPSEFLLVQGDVKPAWPRSGLGSDPALEAYLVRHNQMLANTGLGGFVPYVDVVSRESLAFPAGESGEQGGAEAGAGAEPQ